MKEGYWNGMIEFSAKGVELYLINRLKFPVTTMFCVNTFAITTWGKNVIRQYNTSDHV